MRGLLWDLDGTLVDSVGDLAAAINRMLDGAGLRRLDPDAVRARVGHGARRLVSDCVEAAGGVPTEAHLQQFLTAYASAVSTHTVVHPPALRGVLDRWHGLPMAIVTNKPEGITRSLLRELDLERYFPVVLGGDSTETLKPHPAMIHRAMEHLGVTSADVVGDSTNDVRAGHAAGQYVIGVGWGIGRPDGADVIVEDVPALEAVLAHRFPNR